MPKAEMERTADLFNRTFSVEHPNRLWVANITYMRP